MRFVVVEQAAPLAQRTAVISMGAAAIEVAVVVDMADHTKAYVASVCCVDTLAAAPTANADAASFCVSDFLAMVYPVLWGARRPPFVSMLLDCNPWIPACDPPKPAEENTRA